MSEEPDLPLPPSEEVTQSDLGPAGGDPIFPPAPAPRRDSPERHQPPLVPDTAASVIGDFEVLEKLGQGGMGAVYRARQRSLGRVVALKILPAKMVEDADAVARFPREARVAAGLSHANLVPVYAAGEADGCHFIAMELIEGEDLGRRLKRGGRLPAPEALRFCAEVARGLEHAWGSGQLIHRDIKPGNIFLTAAGGVKLGDLGLAKLLDSQSTGLTQTGTVMGTPHYISPEQAHGDREIDFRADIYSLGCTLYEMLTGERPYRGSDALTIIRQHLDAPPPAILKVWPQCPVPLARLVGRMVKKSGHERPASYAELIAELERVREVIERGDDSGAAARVALWREIGGAASPAPAPRPTPPAPAGPRKSKLPLYGGLAAVAAALLGGGFFGARPKAGSQASRLPAGRSGGTPDFRSAIRERPFVNTLGMQFVPVPILGGPSGGTRVLFGVWDVRVQDYEMFARETKREWPKADFAQEATHPAVNVSWEDAQAFCAWLTGRERKAGKLGANERSRLPSDHEWSCAVGIGGREDAAKLPEEKHQKINDVFPWGSAWPPPAGAGNYAGEELAPALAAGKYNNLKGVLPGYRDSYVTIAPVGSFGSDGFGLCDLSGNVREWCEDWFNKDQKDRVLRGASWGNYDRGVLRSSHRTHYAPGFRGYTYGFRCVVSASARKTAKPDDSARCGAGGDASPAGAKRPN